MRSVSPSLFPWSVHAHFPNGYFILSSLPKTSITVSPILSLISWLCFTGHWKKIDVISWELPQASTTLFNQPTKIYAHALCPSFLLWTVFLRLMFLHINYSIFFHLFWRIEFSLVIGLFLPAYKNDLISSILKENKTQTLESTSLGPTFLSSYFLFKTIPCRFWLTSA